MQYARAFDSKTAFSCTPQTHGFVNEITLSEYTGENQFSFRVSLSGGTLLDSTGYSIPIADAEDAVQGHIVLRELTDAAGNISTDNLIDVAQYEDGDYLVTVTLDEAFLQDPGTQYPVALSAATKTLTAAYINDTHVTSTSPNTNYASAALMKSGDAGSDSLNYIFIQFIFSNTSWYRSIAPDNVTSASLNMYSNNSGAAGKISQGIPTGTWNYQSITWNNRPGMNSDGSYNGVTPPAPSSIHANTGWQTVNVTTFIKASLRNYVDSSLPQTIHELRGLRLWGQPPAVPPVPLLQLRQQRLHSLCHHQLYRQQRRADFGGAGYYGDASAYWVRGAGDPNCWGYALHSTNSVSPVWYVGKLTTLDAGTVTNYVLNYFSEELNKNYRIFTRSKRCYKP